MDCFYYVECRKPANKRLRLDKGTTLSYCGKHYKTVVGELRGQLGV